MHIDKDHISSDYDYVLIRQSMKGDVEAFRELVKRQQEYVYAIAFKILLQKQDAEDIVQETFIRVWLNIKFFDFQGKFTTWLYKIVLNLCMDKLRQKNRHKIDYKESIEDGMIHTTEDMMLATEEKDMIEFISKAARNLSPKQKMVFILRDIHDFSIEEVSHFLNMAKSSVKSNLCHARNHIRLYIKNSEEINHEMQ